MVESGPKPLMSAMGGKRTLALWYATWHFYLRNDLEPEPMRGVGRTDFVKNQRKCLNL